VWFPAFSEAKKRMAIVFMLALAPTPLLAEIYQGINYMDSLGKVRKCFPAAAIQKLSPAWAKPTDAMYSIKGNGIAGTVIIKFGDYRPAQRKLIERSNPGPGRDEMEKEAAQSDEDALYVEWVRWVPDSPIPLKRLVEKYGQWDKKDIHEQTYQPQRIWTKKKITAHISDDDKYVQMIDFNFTGAEKIMGCRRNSIPVTKDLEHFYLSEDKPEPKSKKGATGK